MLKLDKDKAYRLVNVLDHEGNAKVGSRDLYLWLIGCVGTHMRKGTEYDGGKFSVRVDFVQRADGQWINHNLCTSPVLDIREENGCLLIVTMNSVYVFEPAYIKPPVYRHEAELIELYLSDGRAVQVQGTMEGAYAFMDHAFSAWLKQTGRTREDCPFYDPQNSCWFPPVEA